ncbi:Kv channel-interacting protein 1-like [Schistocerca gregaria]|uniref:Kv channel-interacting protein 1-like n=1 Tax=Schistocerca gregaria TaxID=7010 RepID=UPI00211DBD54|nr:Kv channel-interacting protein 1-like [Schistocerca gregaria]
MVMKDTQHPVPYQESNPDPFAWYAVTLPLRSGGCTETPGQTVTCCGSDGGRCALFVPDVDLDEEEGPPPERHRPDRLEAISRTTRFSRQEIRYIYRTFKQECPSGAINEATFKSIYAKFFPLGDSSQYAHYVFAALDRSHTGTVTFGDLMLGLSVVMKGTLHERLRWVFSLYDVNHDGCITRQEMLEVISAIYNLVGDAKDASHTHRTPQQHVERIFKKLDLNHDGVITVDEFINYCSADENVRNSFAVFDDLW